MSATQQRRMVDASVVTAEFDNEVVLLNVASGMYYGLEGVSARIWTLLDAGADTEAIMHTILAEYEVPPDQLREDLQAFLDQLLSKGLIQLDTE